MENPVVTICIPAFQAEGFIDKTLRYARRQTYPHVRIVVSIDQSDDRTEEICRRHAGEDHRVTVIAHRTRLGWARNVNFLLDNVASDYFFIYPHDDIIESIYVETLLAQLVARPDAASVQCDVLYVQPDGRQGLQPGRTHEGPVSRRIIASLVDASVGEPLRSLIRSDVADAGLRFPLTSARGFDAHQPFQTRLLAAGPALHVPQILYWRWGDRKGGMVDSWTTVPIDAVIADLRANAEATLELIDHSEASPSERTVMQFALYLNQLIRLRDFEALRRTSTLVDPRAVSPLFAFDRIPSALGRLEPDVQEWVTVAHVNLIRKEMLHYLRVGDVRRARTRLRTLSVANEWIGMPALGRRYAARMLRQWTPVELPRDLQDRLAG